MLDVADISVNYGQTPCLRRISLNVARGEAVALIGANGAGKTTLLKTISGLLRPSGGEIRFEGQPIHGLPPQAIVARGIVHVPEGRRIFPDLSVEHNLRIGAHLIRDRAIMAQGLDEVFQRFPRLAERRRQPGGTLSGGEQQMLAIGRALMARPRLLLLDEPSLGLAPIAVLDVTRAIAALKDAGVTVLLVEQNAMLALGLVDRGYVIETGEIVMSGESAVLREHPKVLASYLGFTAS